MSKGQPSQPGRRHGKGHVQMCSWMQWVTGQRRLKSAVAVRCALQATLTRHVRNALCASVSVLSETVSSSIMACELVSDVATSDCDITLNFTASVLFCDTVFSGFFYTNMIFAMYFYITGTKLQFNCYVLGYCLLNCIYELISNFAVLGLL